MKDKRARRFFSMYRGLFVPPPSRLDRLRTWFYWAGGWRLGGWLLPSRRP